MACNCPIITTDVGDVRKILGSTEGCFITSFDSDEIGEKIDEVIRFGKKTIGRKRIEQLGYDINTVAKKVLSVYHSTL